MAIKRSFTLICILVVILSLVLSACGPGGDNADKSPEGEGKAQGKNKITICHRTEDAANPYVELSLPESALKGHKKHDGDIIPAPAGGCP